MAAVGSFDLCQQSNLTRVLEVAQTELNPINSANFLSPELAFVAKAPILFGNLKRTILPRINRENKVIGRSSYTNHNLDIFTKRTYISHSRTSLESSLPEMSCFGAPHTFNTVLPPIRALT